jgi:hypothetical protein
MLLDAIATVILAGLMLIPFLNVIIGAVIGAGLAGPPGAFVGILTGAAIVALETWIADRLGWRDLRCVSTDVAERLADERVAGGGRSITAGRPARRAMPRRVRDMKQTPRPARAGNMRTA